tara:strand:- start:1944 stop:2213 length:270 start_codon:yes stop_codon:yes gene_type:complete
MNERKEVLWRILVGIVSGIILSIWKILIYVLVLVQLVIVLVNGKKDKQIAKLCNTWNTQVYKYIRYLTFTSNERVFPFEDLGKDIQPIK